MTGSDRGGLWMAVAAALLVLGAIAYFVIGSGDGGGKPATPETISKPADDAADAARGFRPSELPVPEPLETRPPASSGLTPPVADVGAGKPVATDIDSSVVARGHLRWSGGRLPAESDVLLYDDEGFDLDITSADGDGYFELSCDEPLAAGWSFGTDEITVLRNGTPTALVPVLAGELPVHMPGDPPVERDLLLGYAPTLSGRVFDKATGAPVDGAEVYASCTLPPWSYDALDTLTGTDGTYTLPLEGLPLQRLVVWCAAEDHQGQLSGPLDVQPASVAGELVRMDFALTPLLIVRGRVVDERSGEPIDGATITVGSRYTAFADSSDWEVTDPDGTFELDSSGIPLDGGWLVFGAADNASLMRPLADGTQFMEVRLGPAVMVAGSVRDELGAPVPGASVRIVFDGDTPMLDQGMFDETYCDAQGRFDLQLETVPPAQAIVRMTDTTFAPYSAPLADVAKPGADGTWLVEIKLRGN